MTYVCALSSTLVLCLQLFLRMEMTNLLISYTILGGPDQLPHLAPTYAAVCSLCILGRYWRGAYDIINRCRSSTAYVKPYECIPVTRSFLLCVLFRQKLAEFLTKRRMNDGSFTMHKDGEVDIR